MNIFMRAHDVDSSSLTTSPRYGVLLINVGTPDKCTPLGIRRYLKAFLSDPYVVPLSPWLWQPILRGWILNSRPFSVAQKYAAIWLKNGSPLKVYSERQAKRLQQTLKKKYNGHHIQVATAMRYGTLSISETIQSMQKKGVTHWVILPLYPQYAIPTTVTSIQAVCHQLLMHTLPNMRIISHFSSHASYIQALATSVKTHWQKKGRGNLLLMSFHGLPQQSLDRKEPYFYQCQATAKALAKALQLKPDQWTISFQSRWGLQRWLQPYTDDVLHRLGQAKTKALDIICPSFVTDCLETLHTIQIEGASIFHQAGGGQYRYIACLNDTDVAIEAFADIVSAELNLLSVTQHQTVLSKKNKKARPLTTGLKPTLFSAECT